MSLVRATFGGWRRCDRATVRHRHAAAAGVFGPDRRSAHRRGRGASRRSHRYPGARAKVPSPRVDQRCQCRARASFGGSIGRTGSLAGAGVWGAIESPGRRIESPRGRMPASSPSSPLATAVQRAWGRVCEQLECSKGAGQSTIAPAYPEGVVGGGAGRILAPRRRVCLPRREQREPSRRHALARLRLGVREPSMRFPAHGHFVECHLPTLAKVATLLRP